ncbi:MAG: isocitrate/isopropylmalate family dehydrogenase, partial [Solirubrobacteraceae bacterium]
AGAESILLSFDQDYNTTVAMAEAPHGTAPALQGKDLANPLAMILACGAILNYAGQRYGASLERASRAIYEAALETVAGGIKTFDLGGSARSTEFTTAVVERIATKREVWSSLR